MESELIERCLQGESAAWDELFTLHYQAVAHFVFKISPDFRREDVEEICQEVFLSVIRNLKSFKGNSQLQTWIFRIAANKARDFWEKTMAAKRGGGVVPLSLQAEDPHTGLQLDPPSPAVSPDRAILQKERVDLVARSLEELEAPCREVIALRYFGDLSYEEIAHELDLNVKTVSSRLSKCLDRLEEIVKPKLKTEQSQRFSV